MNPTESSPYFQIKALHPHTVDVMRYFCGDVEAVQCFATKAPGRKIWSTAHFNMRFKNGVVGGLTGSYDIERGHPMERCEVAGTGGRFVLEDMWREVTLYPAGNLEKTVYTNPVFGGMRDFEDTFRNRIHTFLRAGDRRRRRRRRSTAPAPTAWPRRRCSPPPSSRWRRRRSCGSSRERRWPVSTDAYVQTGRAPGRTLGALVDLTRMLYFGPPVLSLFVLGSVLAMPEGPVWSAIVRVLFAGGVGFAGGFVLNDWADWRADKAMLAARAHDAEYMAQLRRERPFTGTRPIAAGIISPRAGLAFALALIAASAAVCLTFPSPHRWYLVGALAYCTVAEPVYCFIKRKQKGLFPFATFFHAPLEALCPAMAYLAVRRPDLTPLGLFASMYFWEVGFNQLYDTIDVENDRLRGITTLSSVLGVRFVAAWGFTFSLLCTAAYTPSHGGCPTPARSCSPVCSAQAPSCCGADAFLFARPTHRAARATINIHLAQVMLVVGAATLGAALHWVGVV